MTKTNNRVLNIHRYNTLATQYEMSPYTLIKRDLRYRISKTDNCCGNCKMKYSPVFEGIERLQCYWIGVYNDKTADIDENYICDFHHRICEKTMEDNDGKQLSIFGEV